MRLELPWLGATEREWWMLRIVKQLLKSHSGAQVLQPDSLAKPVLRSVAIGMVRNEQDIIEPFLRHNAQFVDLMILLDNRSADRTREIAMSVARELGNIVVSDLPDRGYNQSRTMTRMLREVQSAVFADFVLFLDADEFISAPDRAALEASLDRLEPGTLGLMPWRTYLPAPEGTEGDPMQSIQYRRSEEAPQFYKAVLRLGGSVMPDLLVQQGSHSVVNGRAEQLPATVLSDLPLWHVPLRSSDQLRTKGIVGWMANQARENATQVEAFQWAHLNELAGTGEELGPERVAAESLAYAQDPREGNFADHVVAEAIPLRSERRYSDGSFGDPEQLIAAARNGASHDGFVLPPPPEQSRVSAGIENAFEGEWHWHNQFLDVAPIRFMVDRLQPTSIIDIGCGNGIYPLLYRHLGVADVFGVDGIAPEATVLDEKSYRQVDLQESFDAGRKFDVAVCMEVVEHLNPQTTDTAFDSIERHAERAIVFSMAEPGQPGNGHINCRTMLEVLDDWADRGWYPDLNFSLGMRALSSMSWFRRNIVVLTRDATEPMIAKQALQTIGSFEYQWWPQDPGVRDFAFAEDYPEPPLGYGRRLPVGER